MNPRPQRGQVWWAFTPNQPKDDEHQPRTVVIVSNDVRNNAVGVDDVIVIPTFSETKLSPPRVPVDSGEGGIDHDSTLYCEEIVCLDLDFLVNGPLGGKVEQVTLEEAILGVRRALGEEIYQAPGR